MSGMRFTIGSETDLIKAINKYGFLPYFRNSIEGFSALLVRGGGRCLGMERLGHSENRLCLREIF